MRREQGDRLGVLLRSIEEREQAERRARRAANLLLAVSGVVVIALAVGVALWII